MEELTQTTVPEAFRETVARCGDRAALRRKALGLWQDISWNAYEQAAERVGAALIDLGMAFGDRVSIIGDNCPEWVMADMGIQMAGGVSVGIYATNAWSQVQYVVDNSESTVLFVENEEQLDKWLRFRDDVPSLKKVIVWDTEGLRHFTDPMLMTWQDLVDRGAAALQNDAECVRKRSASLSPDDLAALIYTSGTTGPPKGAMLSHGNVTWMAGAVAENNPIFDTDEVLSFLPLCHIFERLFSVFAHVVHGYTVNFVEKLDTVTENMTEVSPTVGYAVPRIWEKYYSAITIRMSDATWLKRWAYNAALSVGRRRADLQTAFAPVPAGLALGFRLAHLAVFRKLKERMGFDRIRVAYSGAAPISPDVLAFFQSIGVNLIEGYGQTEGTGVTTISPMGKVKFGTVGPALPGTEIRIADDGEILVRSPGVFKGYFKRPDATDEDDSGRLAPFRRCGGAGCRRLPADHRPQKGHHRHRRRQEHHPPVYREQAQGERLHQRRRGHR